MLDRSENKPRRRSAIRSPLGAIAIVVVVATAVLGAGPAGAAGRDRTPPTTPTDLRVVALTETSVTLAWDPSTDNSGVFSYSVSKDGQGFTVPQSQTSYKIDWLSPGRTYSFSVTAVDRALNTSGSSNTVVVTSLADTVPPSAPALTATVLGPSQVSLSWTRSTDALSFVGYAVLVDGAVATSHLNWWGERTVVLRHLAPSSTHTFAIRASDSSGNTASSNVVTLTLPASTDVTPPTAPTNARLLFDQGCAEVWIGFTPSTDDVDPAEAIEYEVYVNGVLSPLPVRAGIDREFVYGTVNGLNTFTVKAVDRAGNTSAASNEVTAFLWTC